MAGYSTTPLAQKLGIKPGMRVCVLDAPMDYAALIAPVPEEVRIVMELDDHAEFVHLFVTRQMTLALQLKTFREQLGTGATVWVSWPKKTSNRPTEVNEHDVRHYALPLGFVDVKVCAVDATWSGLKLVIRKTLR